MERRYLSSWWLKRMFGTDGCGGGDGEKATPQSVGHPALFWAAGIPKSISVMTRTVSRLWSGARALHRPVAWCHPGGLLGIAYPHSHTCQPTRSSSTIDNMDSKMLRSNRLKQVFSEAKRPAMGFWQMLPGANISRTLARAGADWVMVDCEHGNMDDAAMHEAVPAIAALGVSPIVRLPDLQPWMVKRALDTGAHGILIPLIRTVDEVESVVAAAKFPPQGRRGFGSPFAMHNFEPGLTSTEYLQQANDSLLTMVQIETREALESVEKIAPLVDVVFIGPFDLGNNIGHPILDGKMDPELHDAIERILGAAVRAGKKCGIYCTSGEQAKHYADKGFHMISVATDFTALGDAMADALAIARGESKRKKGGSY